MNASKQSLPGDLAGFRDNYVASFGALARTGTSLAVAQFLNVLKAQGAELRQQSGASIPCEPSAELPE